MMKLGNCLAVGNENVTSNSEEAGVCGLDSDQMGVKQGTEVRKGSMSDVAGENQTGRC